MTVASATATFATDAYSADVSERYVTHYGSIVIDASSDTYATGGLALDLKAAPGVASVPVEVRIWSEGDASALYTYVYHPGTTIANGLIVVYAAATEASAAGVPAGVSGDTIKFSAKFKKGT